MDESSAMTYHSLHNSKVIEKLVSLENQKPILNAKNTF